ncbi:MAG TPA: FadR/GntR family transcriptional regulator [Candidatus Angelobacter sp.]|jgi:DNA-binding FadR family transcriptional regulator|nr:FadR/GntR family transcriptional regulator [Candidatus Angelobacter sp.]
MTEMKANATSFAQLESTENLHSRVTRALALQVMKSAEQSELIMFPNEGELCKQLGVSRSILREAVKVLADKGMVQVRPRSGTRARPRSEWNQLDPDILAWQSQFKPDPRFLRDLCEVRLSIEPIAAGFAALRASDEEIVLIRECMGRRMQIVAAQDLTAAVEADLQYHRAVIAASHNPLFLQLNTTIGDPFRLALSYTLLLPASVALELEEYRKLTEAIEDRNPLAARRAAEEIVGFAMLAVEQVIRDQESHKNTGAKARRGRESHGLHIERGRPEP